MLHTANVVGVLFNEKNEYLKEVVFKDTYGHVAFGTYNPKTKTWFVIYGNKEIFDIVYTLNGKIKSILQ